VRVGVSGVGQYVNLTVLLYCYIAGLHYVMRSESLQDEEQDEDVMKDPRDADPVLN